MKVKLCTLTAVLVLLLSMALPVHGANQWMTKDPLLSHVTDRAGLLDSSQIAELERQAADISRQHDFGVYIVTVDDYRDYTEGDLFDATLAIYQQYSLGLGPDKNGVVLLLSMAKRDSYLLTHGAFGQHAFNQDGREFLTNYFLDDFKLDSWYDGFADYLFWCGEYLSAAEQGEPYSSSNIPMSTDEKIAMTLMVAGGILLISVVIGGIYIFILTLRMQSVAQATKASVYLSGALQLHESWDRYTHSTQRRRKIERRSSSTGGTSSRSSGRASGTGGKF